MVLKVTQGTQHIDEDWYRINVTHQYNIGGVTNTISAIFADEDNVGFTIIPQGNSGEQGACGASGACGPQGGIGVGGACGPEGEKGPCGPSNDQGAALYYETYYSPENTLNYKLNFTVFFNWNCYIFRGYYSNTISE